MNFPLHCYTINDNTKNIKILVIGHKLYNRKYDNSRYQCIKRRVILFLAKITFNKSFIIYSSMI